MKVWRIVLFLGCWGILGTANLAASGSRESDPQFDFRNFDALEAGGGIQIEVVKGDSRVELVQGSDPGLEVHQRGSTLVFGHRPSFGGLNVEPVRFRVTLPVLRGANLGGGAGVVTTDTFSGTLNLQLSGGSAFTGGFEGDRLTVRIDGGGVVAMTGSAKILLIDASGGARFQSRPFVASEAELHLSGGADAQLTIQELAQIDASGGSSVEYSGSPRLLQHVSGGATIQSLD